MPFVRHDRVGTKIAWNQKMQCYGLENTKLRRREREHRSYDYNSIEEAVEKEK